MAGATPSKDEPLIGFSNLPEEVRKVIDDIEEQVKEELNPEYALNIDDENDKRMILENGLYFFITTLARYLHDLNMSGKWREQDIKQLASKAWPTDRRRFVFYNLLFPTNENDADKFHKVCESFERFLPNLNGFIKWKRKICEDGRNLKDILKSIVEKSPKIENTFIFMIGHGFKEGLQIKSYGEQEVRSRICQLCDDMEGQGYDPDCLLVQRVEENGKVHTDHIKLPVCLRENIKEKLENFMKVENIGFDNLEGISFEHTHKGKEYELDIAYFSEDFMSERMDQLLQVFAFINRDRSTNASDCTLVTNDINTNRMNTNGRNIGGETRLSSHLKLDPLFNDPSRMLDQLGWLCDRGLFTITGMLVQNSNTNEHVWTRFDANIRPFRLPEEDSIVLAIFFFLSRTYESSIHKPPVLNHTVPFSQNIKPITLDIKTISDIKKTLKSNELYFENDMHKTRKVITKIELRIKEPPRRSYSMNDLKSPNVERPTEKDKQFISTNDVSKRVLQNALSYPETPTGKITIAWGTCHSYWQGLEQSEKQYRYKHVVDDKHFTTEDKKTNIIVPLSSGDIDIEVHLELTVFLFYIPGVRDFIYKRLADFHDVDGKYEDVFDVSCLFE